MRRRRQAGNAAFLDFQNIHRHPVRHSHVARPLIGCAWAEPLRCDRHGVGAAGDAVALGRHGHRVCTVEAAGDDSVRSRGPTGRGAGGIDRQRVAGLLHVALGGSEPFRVAANLEAQCPLWVKSGHRSTSDQCLLYPQKRTLELSRGMSALCQKRTNCIAESRVLFDQLVGTCHYRRR